MGWFKKLRETRRDPGFATVRSIKVGEGEDSIALNFDRPLNFWVALGEAEKARAGKPHDGRVLPRIS